ncbi:hypothetical protein C0Q70_21162 [Pomacea canaliculata]|uniref:Uncharacterized protein n=1 Tax=Pomacea canaliculata TaxID=400727 RepID=A0A2T7NBU1_POMCA|nr:hypothetical protein C0Q70_21162 [Pomacea canaliculata]
MVKSLMKTAIDRVDLNRRSSYLSSIRGRTSRRRCYPPRLQHQNIVSLLTTISYQGRLGLVLEFCESGSLEQCSRLTAPGSSPSPWRAVTPSNLHAALEFVPPVRERSEATPSVALGLSFWPRRRGPDTPEDEVKPSGGCEDFRRCVQTARDRW